MAKSRKGSRKGSRKSRKGSRKSRKGSRKSIKDISKHYQKQLDNIRNNNRLTSIKKLQKMDEVLDRMERRYYKKH